MAKYIDADALMDELNNQFRDMNNNVYDSQDDALEDAEVSVRQIIHNMPAADVELVRKWTPCNERLPDEGKNVLVYWERLDKKTNTVYGCIDIMYRTSECGWYCDGRGKLNWGAIVWMPLPKPPKMDGGSE